MRPVIAGSESSIGVKVPRQQLADAIDGVIGDSGQHRTQVGFWITVVQLCCSYQAIDRSCSFASGVRPSEQVVLAAESNGS